MDTLQLVEIGSIQAPSAITGLYVEDLDGDSLKEIIICTDYYVYIYNSQTYQVEWTSPPLNHPMDLLFEDINRNGFIDFSVKDSTNIYLFDPHTPQTIWTSPVLDSTYTCYTIGDRNEDDWIDVAIVRKELFTRIYYPNNMDTAWVDIYDGPIFSEHETFYFLLWNYSVAYQYILTRRTEIPFVISINEISSTIGTDIKILIYSFSREYMLYYWFHTEAYNSGSLSIFDADNFSQIQLSEFNGKLLYYEYLHSDNTVLLNAITYGSDTSQYLYGYYSNNWDIYTCSADSVIRSCTLYRWYSSWPDLLNWDGLIIGDFDFIDNAPEISYSAEDTLVLLRFPEVDTLWMREVTDIDSVLYRFVDSSLYASPQVVCAIGDPLIEYQFFSGSDGSLSAILPDSGYELSKVSDLNNDSHDEILSIQNTSLHIYSLDYATAIGEDMNLPHRAFLRPNYPNPFNSQTTIEYGLPEAGRVRIDIYDLLGRKVETLVDEERQAGRHQVIWDASRYSSGIYFYRIEAGDFVDTKRMVYLK
ncbi:MAG: T9SS type A sorting domain-containing protein [Candidatus Zixiibacteriota bacterium]|nr:MAG: T9SS type A sorting domain-containing protein [candidate division Zixibacteria bacterium]